MAVVATRPGRPVVGLAEPARGLTGVLSAPGHLLSAGAERTTALAARLRITVATADTRGTAAAELAGFPVDLVRVRCGGAEADLVRRLGAEGTAAASLREADVVAADVLAALDPLTGALRPVATLRG